MSSKKKNANPLQRLDALGQSVWLASIPRHLFHPRGPPRPRVGIAAIRRLIGDGINVNVTLLFSQAAYEQAAEAYVSGLEALAARGGDPGGGGGGGGLFVRLVGCGSCAR